MAYVLRSALSDGRVTDDDYGEFRFRGGRLECDDYDAAAALVDRYSYLEWLDGDPGPPEDADDGADDDSDADTDASGDADDGDGGADADAAADGADAGGHDDADGADTDDGDAADDGDGADDPDEFDADAWLDRDYEARAEAVRDGEVDAHLDAVESADRSTTVLDAVAERRDALEGE